MEKNVRTGVWISLDQKTYNHLEFFEVLMGIREGIQNPIKLEFIPIQVALDLQQNFVHFHTVHEDEVGDGFRIDFIGQFTEKEVDSINETLAYLSKKNGYRFPLKAFKIRTQEVTIVNNEMYF